MVSIDLQKWFEKNRRAALDDARTRGQLRAIFEEEEFLSPKAREKLFDHFIEEGTLDKALPEHVTRDHVRYRREGHLIQYDVYRDHRTGRFTSLARVRLE